MDIKVFIEKFAEQFEETDANVIKAETVFKELEEWSSLVALMVIGMVDEEFCVTITGEDIRNATTVNDLFNAVKKKL